jgi:excisionase family DNA binding protein
MGATIIERAREVAQCLRDRGETSDARVVEELIEEAVGDEARLPQMLTTTAAGRRLGVSGQTIKNWVARGELRGVRVGGRIKIPAASVLAYVQRARSSLDWDELTDEEAVRVARAIRHGER